MFRDLLVTVFQTAVRLELAFGNSVAAEEKDTEKELAHGCHFESGNSGLL